MLRTVVGILIVACLGCAPSSAEPFKQHSFALHHDRLNLDNWAIMPAEDWEPTFSGSRLGLRLPFDWDEQYREEFKQNFQPNAFYNNAIALCNYAEKFPDRKADAARLFDELFARMMEFTDEGDGALWIRSDFDFRRPKGMVNTAPWYGGLMNAFVLTGLIRATDCFDAPEYRQAMAGLVQAFSVIHHHGQPPPDRWFSYVDENGYLWFDEYLNPGGMASRVLNGHIFAVLALAVYAEKTGDQTIFPLIDGSLTTLKENILSFRRARQINSYALLIPEYKDYDPVRTVRQQCQLFSLTGDEVFLGMAHIFRQDIEDADRRVPIWTIRACGSLRD